MEFILELEVGLGESKLLTKALEQIQGNYITQGMFNDLMSDFKAPVGEEIEEEEEKNGQVDNTGQIADRREG